jgi:chromosome segregation ATPase
MAPGTYSVLLSREVDGVVTDLAGPVSFEVKQLKEGALEGSTQEEIAIYRTEVEDMQQAVRALSVTLQNANDRLNALRLALYRAPIERGGLAEKLHDLNQELLALDEELNGNRSKQEIGENSPPTVRSRIGIAAQGTYNMLYGPTAMHKENLEFAKSAYRDIREKVVEITNERIPAFERELQAAGAPWIEGQPLPEK